MVVLEIHHGIELVHESAAEPVLRLLAHLGACVPSVARIAAEVVVLTYGRAADLHPRLAASRTLCHLFDDACDVASAFVEVDTGLPRLGVSDIVEVNAVDVIASCHLLADGRDIACGGGVLRVEERLLADASHYLWVPFAQLSAAVSVPFAYGYAHDPCVELHATAMTLVDGEGERVVARRLSGMARHGTVPRFDV